MTTLKCYVCKKTQPILEFQSFKSCQTCRKKKNKKEITPIVSLEVLSTTLSLESLNSIHNTIETKIEPTKHKIQWCLLSGKWIRKGEEKRLHTILLKKVNRQFLNRCAFPIHKYLTKHLMTDIRDL